MDQRKDAAQTIAAEKLYRQVLDILAGNNDEIVGAVIGQVLAVWIAAHHPMLRDEVSAMLFGMVRDLVPMTVEEMIESGKCGDDWREVTRQ